MPFESSSIPRAIDGLVAMCRDAAVPSGLLDGVTIEDGPSVGDPSDQLLLYVADTPTAGAVGALGTQAFASMPGRERDETYSIYCTAYSRSGDTALKPERDRAFAIMAAVEKLLRPGFVGSDLTLGGAVVWCSVSGRIAYTPGQSESGAIVRLDFEIACRARLSGA